MPLDARCNSCLDIPLAPVAIPPRRNSPPHGPLATVALPARWNSHPSGSAPGCCVRVRCNSCLYAPLTPFTILAYMTLDARHDPAHMCGACWDSRCMPCRRLWEFPSARPFAPFGIRARILVGFCWSSQPDVPLAPVEIHARMACWSPLQFPHECGVGTCCNSCPHAALTSIGICTRMSPYRLLEFIPTERCLGTVMP